MAEQYLLARGGRAYHRIDTALTDQADGWTTIRCNPLFAVYQWRMLTLQEIEALHWTRKPHPCSLCFPSAN